MFQAYADYDGLGLAELIRRGDVSAGEVLEAAIARIEAVNPSLNAVVRPLFERARNRLAAGVGDGPLSGVPFLVKDLLAQIDGVPTGNGNRLWAGQVARGDSELVRRWQAAGLVIAGRTNTPEFGLTPYTESGASGPAHNPWDVSRTPGGSSGGSAAAVASGMVPIASGGDGGGSIRIPASACGIFGMKPTRGRTPAGPFIGEAWSGFAVEHVLTRSVRDSAAVLDATHGPDVGSPHPLPVFAGSYLEAVSRMPGRLKIAVSKAPMLGKAVSPEVLAAFDEAVSLLTDLGHEVVEAAPPVDREAFSMAFLTALAGELRADIEFTAKTFGLSIRPADYDASSFGMGLLGDGFSAAELVAAHRYLKLASRSVLGFFTSYDVLMTPVLSSLPVKIGALQPSAAEKALLNVLGYVGGGWLLKKLGIAEQLAAQTFEFIPWTPVFNVTGQPAMSVPIGWSKEGLPIGMQFVGRFADEETLYSLAGQLEQARPWKDRRPALLSAGTPSAASFTVPGPPEP
ncbi:amidase [Rhizobium sp. Root274]|uniref:amidase n=1 Tax=unclassified Rhizobium TaxID=2613769 RepID=UPI000714DE91|nr:MULTISPECIES: amidase [unclassified Rhizobium]KQW28921.1 amidase [Rhizobium sp. Root1240]KRD29117.1 amidase [Rhizobium sp. Root274]